MRTTKFSATASQKTLVTKIMRSLQQREMAILTGREDGKTRVHYCVVGSLGIYDANKIFRHIYPQGHPIVRAKTQHSEDPEVIILPGLQLQSPTMNSQRAIRQIMEHCGLDFARNMTSYQLGKRWRELLVDLFSRNIILSIAIDNAELLPRRNFGIIKELNELQVDKMDVGIAAMIAGQTHRMKCDMAFRRHGVEYQVGRITAEEMAQVVQTHFPVEAGSFTKQSLEHLAKLGTVLDAIYEARLLVETKKQNKMPRIDNDVIALAKAA